MVLTEQGEMSFQEYFVKHRCRPAARGFRYGAEGRAALTPEVRGALEDNVASIVATAADCLGEAPPELAQDIIFQGIHLTGGGALLRGMTQRLADATAVQVHLVDTPLECVVQGAGVCLESFDKLKRLFSDEG